MAQVDPKASTFCSGSYIEVPLPVEIVDALYPSGTRTIAHLNASPVAMLALLGVTPTDQRNPVAVHAPEAVNRVTFEPDDEVVTPTLISFLSIGR